MAAKGRISSGMPAALLALVLAVLASGCASAGSEVPAAARSPVPTASTLDIRVITDKEHGFRMAYPAGWVQSEWKRPTGESTSPLEYVLAYADPEGAQAGGSYVDAEQVSVYRVNRAVRAEELTKDTARAIVADVMLKGLPGLTLRGNDLKQVSVHGTPGWQIAYEYAVAGKTVMASSVLFTKGRSAYWMTMQASPYSWRTVNPTLGTCLNYFRVL